MKTHIRLAAQAQARSLRRTGFVMKLIVFVVLSVAAACAYGLFLAAKADGQRAIEAK